MPAILTAPDRASANARLLAWIERLGPVPACEPCLPEPRGDLSERPSIAWLKDQDLLGYALSDRLQSIHRDRTGRQFYVSATALGNPSFDHELSYPQIRFPDSGYQLLALFRWWNILQNWSPYREAAGQDWNAVLSGFIPKLALADSKAAYQRALFELLAKANDTHANLWSSLAILPPAGECAVPVRLRFIEDQVIVDRIDDPDAGIQRGDTIVAVDGTPVAALVQQFAPFYPASNDAARKRDLATFLTRGACGPASLDVIRDGDIQHIASMRTKFTRTALTHDLPGATFRLLSPEVAYVKLSDIKVTDLPAYFDKAVGTKGLIVDIRNYPSEFMPFAMGSYFVTKTTPFVSFALMDAANPGAFSFSGGLPHIRVIEPGRVHYDGRVVILVDEASQSQSEYTAMALRATPNAIIVGSTTAGADGDISAIPLPGAGIGTAISGIGVYYPDHRPTQRVGIVPDIFVKPTVRGIASGRDEVLDAALNVIKGK